MCRAIPEAGYIGETTLEVWLRTLDLSGGLATYAGPLWRAGYVRGTSLEGWLHTRDRSERQLHRRDCSGGNGRVSVALCSRVCGAEVLISKMYVAM